MKICITPDSVKLFYAYFDTVAEKMKQEALDKASFSALLKEFYDEAIKDFANSELTEDELKELVLQHLTVLPKILEEKLVFSSNKKLKDDVDYFKKQVIEGLKDLDSLVGVLTRLNSAIGKVSIIPTVPVEQEEDFRFDAVSFLFSKTENQDTKVSSALSFKDNVKDENNTLTTAVTVNVIKSENAAGLRFKAMLFKDLSGFKTLSTEKNFLSDDLVMVLVNNKDEIVSFDSQGNVSEEGSVPVYWVKTTAKEFSFKLEALVDIFLEKYKMSRPEAEKRVKEAFQLHLQTIESVKENLAAGKNVFLPINTKESSSGFLENVFKTRTNLSNISNLDKVEVHKV
jgi:hypothetical protein